MRRKPSWLSLDIFEKGNLVSSSKYVLVHKYGGLCVGLHDRSTKLAHESVNLCGDLAYHVTGLKRIESARRYTGVVQSFCPKCGRSRK